jgi:hypothetical protein
MVFQERFVICREQLLPQFAQTSAEQKAKSFWPRMDAKKRE